MPIVKTSPSELAIHGGGPPAFASKIAVFSANVGDGHRFSSLAERMFMAHETPGELVEEFEGAVSAWLDVRNVIGFSSQHAAIRCLARSCQSGGQFFLPALSAADFAIEEASQVEC